MQQARDGHVRPAAQGRRSTVLARTSMSTNDCPREEPRDRLRAQLRETRVTAKSIAGRDGDVRTAYQLGNRTYDSLESLADALGVGEAVPDPLEVRSR